MMNSRQQEEDERRAIEAYTGDSKFQNLLKNILTGTFSSGSGDSSINPF